MYVVMQKQSILFQRAWFKFGIYSDENFDSRIPRIAPSYVFERTHARSFCMRAKIPALSRYTGLAFSNSNGSHTLQVGKIKGISDENQGESDEEDELCPVECVREFKTDEEFFKILERAKETDSLIVVDFYRTSCGSCKYIEQGFAKLCKGSGDQEAPVIFLKHNVLPCHGQFVSG